MDEVEAHFGSAVQFITASHKSLVISTDIQLKLYGLFKQANEGPCDTPKPWFFQFAQRKKWNSWNDLGDMTQTEAMKEYIQLVMEICPAWHPTSSSAMGPVFSRPSPIEDDVCSSICDFAVVNDVEKIKLFLEQGVNINWKDEEGRTALHMAADRNHIELVHYLLNQGADVNSIDKEGNTPLHYACTCDHSDIVRALLSYSPDLSIENEDGERAVDMCNDENKNLFPSE